LAGVYLWLNGLPVQCDRHLEMNSATARTGNFQRRGQLCSRLCWFVPTAVYAASNIFNWEWYNPKNEKWKKWMLPKVDLQPR